MTAPECEKCVIMFNIRKALYQTMRNFPIRTLNELQVIIKCCKQK